MLRSTDLMHDDCRACYSVGETIARLAQEQSRVFEPSKLFKRIPNSANTESVLYVSSLSEVRQSEAGVAYTQTEDFALKALEMATYCVDTCIKKKQPYER